MVTANQWMGVQESSLGTPSTVEATRAVLAWNRISRKPTSVVFKKPDGTSTATQTVRIEPYSTSDVEATDVSGTTESRRYIVLGVRNHPTVPDTDINVGYMFGINKERFRVVDLILQPGEIQAVCESFR